MPDKLKNNFETYEIESEIGAGDLTISYRARRKSDGAPVLIKVVAPQFTFDAYFISRFKKAINRNISLEHPNIVKTYEVGERDDILYIARELVEAESLAEYLESQGSLPQTVVVDFVKQLAAALDYAHSKAIKHGNLTDKKVFIRDTHVWIADFGIVQAMEDTSLVKKGFGIGNPAYLSPERVKGESPSRTADLYALGILAYQMLTGKPPFSGEATAVIHAQIYEQPPPPHEANRNIRPAVSQAVMRMLSKGMELRFTTGAEFARALQMGAEGSAPITPLAQSEFVPAPTEAKENTNWKRFAILALIVTPVLGCALAAGFWAINQWNLAPAEPTATPVVVAPNIPTPVPTFAVNTNTPTSTIEATLPPPTIAPVSPVATVTPLPTATLIPLPGEAIVAEGSPFSNLILAAGINDNFEPVQPGNIFPPTEDPVYLFFDYKGIQPGISWGLEWRWDDLLLEETNDVWPEDYGAFGTAWVYYSPSFGFEPGPYSISLTVDGVTVATISFVIQAE